MKKILIVLPYFGERIGGMERFVIEISKELKKYFEITIFSGKCEDEISLDKINIIRKKILKPKIFNKLIKYFHLSYLVKKHLRKNKYDYILAMGFSGVFLRGHIWRATGPPISIVEKEKNKQLNFFSKLINKIEFFFLKKVEKKCIENASYLIYPSFYLKNKFEQDYKLKEEKPFFIPCSGVRLNKKIKIKDKKTINVLTINGLSEDRKGKKIIIQTFRELPKKYKLLVVGKVDKKIEEINAEYYGFINYENINKIYEKADIFILPSFYEGFPNTLLEAASFGIPIIASRLEGIEEYFKENKEILLIEKGNYLQLKQKILSLSDLYLRKKLSNNIYKKIRKFDYKKFSTKLINFLEKKQSLNILQ